MQLKCSAVPAALLVCAAVFCAPAYAQLEKLSDEMEIELPVGEPVEIRFRQTVVGGFKPKGVALNMEMRGRSLLITAPNGLPPKGAAVVVRLRDGEEVLLVLKSDPS